MSYKTKDVMSGGHGKPMEGWEYGAKPSGEPTEIPEPCCDAWAKAHERGTDNEGYGAVVGYWDFDGSGIEKPHIGHEDLPPVKFCPWCGAEKGESRGRG
jgi:hypothetical protein